MAVDESYVLHKTDGKEKKSQLRVFRVEAIFPTF